MTAPQTKHLIHLPPLSSAGAQVIPIIDIPGFGDRAAEKVCADLGIKSQNDAKKLAEAKQMVYLKGFTDGVLLVGPHAGKKARIALRRNFFCAFGSSGV